MDSHEESAVDGMGYLKALRVFSIVEGVSTLVLFFIAMPLKYAAGMPMAVTIVGSVHGALFTLLVGAFAACYQLVPLPPKLVWLGIGAMIVPLVHFWLELNPKALHSDETKRTA